MKKPFLYKFIFLYAIIFLGGCINLLYAQCEGGVLIAEDTTRCTNELTTLSLSGAQGSITWQSQIHGSGLWDEIIPQYDETIQIATNVSRDYRAYLTDGVSCNDVSNVITIFVSSFPDEPETNSPDDVCGKAFKTISANPPSIPRIGFWSKTSGPGNVSFYPDSSTSITDSVLVEEYGIYELTWNISDGICTKKDTIKVIASQQNIANAGYDIQQCNVNSPDYFNLGAVLMPGATGIWSSTYSGFTILEPNNPLSQAYANPIGSSYIITWTEMNGKCSDTDQINVYVRINPQANAGVDKSACDISVQLSAQSSSYTKTWRLLESGDIPTFLPNNQTYNATFQTGKYKEDYKLSWTLTNGFCADTDTVVVKLYEQPVATPMLINDTCGTRTILKATTSAHSGQNIIRGWTYTGSFNPILNKINDSTTSVIIAEPNYGAYTFLWTEQNAICIDTANVRVSLFEIPDPFAGVDAENCGNSYLLSAEKSIVGSQSNWRAMDNPANISFTNATEAKTTVTATVYNPYRLIFTETNNTICSASDTLEIEFIEVPQANAGIDADTCAYTYPLIAQQSISGSSGEWFQLGSTDTISLSKGFTTNTTVINDSTYAYMFIEINRICTDTASKLITYYKQAMAEIIEAEDACGLEQTILVSPVTNETAEWTIEPGGGENTILPGAQPGEYHVSVKKYTSYLLNYHVFNNQCSDDTSFTINFYEIPDTKTGNDKAICGKQSILTQHVKPGTAHWNYRGPGTAVFEPLNDNVTRVSVSEFGNYTFLLTGTNEICMSTDTVIFGFTETPISDAGNNEDVCGDSTTLNAQPQTGSWLIISGPGQVNFSPYHSAANAIVNVSKSGRYELQWIARNAACSDTSSLSLSFQNKPLANAGKDQDLINQFETTMNANAPAVGESAEWTLLSGNAQVSSVTNPTASVSIGELGKHLFLWAVQNDAFATCNTSDSVFIVVDDILIPQVITPNGDGENDYFFITGIEDVSPVEISIMNRWGTEVFASSNYANDWDGTSSNGEYLTNDTYFYIINIPNRDIFKGFVVLKR